MVRAEVNAISNSSFGERPCASCIFEFMSGVVRIHKDSDFSLSWRPHTCEFVYTVHTKTSSTVPASRNYFTPPHGVTDESWFALLTYCAVHCLPLPFETVVPVSARGWMPSTSRVQRHVVGSRSWLLQPVAGTLCVVTDSCMFRLLSGSWCAR